MTRRKFIEKIIKTGTCIIFGTGWFIKRMSPRKFLLAIKTKIYPGTIISLKNINKQGKWSG